MLGLFVSFSLLILFKLFIDVLISEGDFRVLVSTTESLESGKVAMIVFGNKGTSGPIMLQGPDQGGPLFKKGNSDEFKVCMRCFCYNLFLKAG